MTQQAAGAKAAGKPGAGGSSVWAAAVPLAVLGIWWAATYNKVGGLIPPPSEVALELWDLAFGGIYDDAFSNTLLTHFIASLSRVYGGFLLAAAVGVPLGLMIGRIPLVRALFEPTLQGA